MYVYSNIIHNNQEVEAIQLSTGNKEEILAICNNTDELEDIILTYLRYLE